MKIYRYTVNNSNYYGQGLDESEVRKCLETKLGTPLNVGSDIIHPRDLSKIARNQPNIEGLSYRMRIPIPSLLNMTLEDLIGHCRGHFDPQQVVSIIKKTLNVDTALEPDMTIRDIGARSNDRILVRTHKHVVKTVNSIDYNSDGTINRVDRRTVTVGYRSIADEFREQIKAILSEDFRIILQFRNTEIKLTELKTKLNKGQLSDEETMHVASEIVLLQNTLAEENNIIHNTGYYINVSPHANNILNYQQFLLELDAVYEKLRQRILRSNMSELPYCVDNPDGPTLLEELDSFVLIQTQNNRYARIN